MKAVQINGYSKRIHMLLRDIPRPQISDSEVLIEVKAGGQSPGNPDSDGKRKIDSGLHHAAHAGQ